MQNFRVGGAEQKSTKIKLKPFILESCTCRYPTVLTDVGWSQQKEINKPLARTVGLIALCSTVQCSAV